MGVIHIGNKTIDTDLCNQLDPSNSRRRCCRDRISAWGHTRVRVLCAPHPSAALSTASHANGRGPLVLHSHHVVRSERHALHHVHT